MQLEICCALNDSHDVVSLGEEGDPVFESALLLVSEVGPVRRDVLRLGGCLAQCSGGILAGENWVVLLVTTEKLMQAASLRG